jgi:hypothetical protein
VQGAEPESICGELFPEAENARGLRSCPRLVSRSARQLPATCAQGQNGGRPERSQARTQPTSSTASTRYIRLIRRRSP